MGSSRGVKRLLAHRNDADCSTHRSTTSNDRKIERPTGDLLTRALDSSFPIPPLTHAIRRVDPDRRARADERQPAANRLSDQRTEGGRERGYLPPANLQPILSTFSRSLVPQQPDSIPVAPTSAAGQRCRPAPARGTKQFAGGVTNVSHRPLKQAIGHRLSAVCHREPRHATVEKQLHTGNSRIEAMDVG
jgi:hypothetical protein